MLRRCCWEKILRNSFHGSIDFRFTKYYFQTHQFKGESFFLKRMSDQLSSNTGVENVAVGPSPAKLSRLEDAAQEGNGINF